MALKRDVAQLTQAFDHLLWATLCDACRLLELTPQELISEIHDMAQHPAFDAWLEAEIEARVAERLAAEAHPPPAPESPPVSAEDGRLDALERSLLSLQDRLTRSEPPT